MESHFNYISSRFRQYKIYKAECLGRILITSHQLLTGYKIYQSIADFLSSIQLVADQFNG